MKWVRGKDLATVTAPNHQPRVDIYDHLKSKSDLTSALSRLDLSQRCPDHESGSTMTHINHLQDVSVFRNRASYDLNPFRADLTRLFAKYPVCYASEAAKVRLGAMCLIRSIRLDLGLDGPYAGEAEWKPVNFEEFMTRLKKQYGNEPKINEYTMKNKTTYTRIAATRGQSICLGCKQSFGSQGELLVHLKEKPRHRRRVQC
jgi:hypothetical protein